MKTSMILLAATMLIAAVSANNSSADDPNYYGNVPTWLQGYFNFMDLILVSIFWKWILYGSWYLTVHLIFCNFFPTVLDFGDFTDELKLTITNEQAKDACKEGFWLWYDTQFYPGKQSAGQKKLNIKGSPWPDVAV